MREAALVHSVNFTTVQGFKCWFPARKAERSSIHVSTLALNLSSSDLPQAHFSYNKEIIIAFPCQFEIDQARYQLQNRISNRLTRDWTHAHRFACSSSPLPCHSDSATQPPRQTAADPIAMPNSLASQPLAAGQAAILPITLSEITHMRRQRERFTGLPANPELSPTHYPCLFLFYTVVGCSSGLLFHCSSWMLGFSFHLCLLGLWGGRRCLPFR